MGGRFGLLPEVTSLSDPFRIGVVELINPGLRKIAQPRALISDPFGVKELNQILGSGICAV